MKKQDNFFTKTFIVNGKVKKRGCMLAVTKKNRLKIRDGSMTIEYIVPTPPLLSCRDMAVFLSDFFFGRVCATNRVVFSVDDFNFY